TQERIERFSDYVDYWAVDFDFQGDTFHNQWQSFRTRKQPRLELESAVHTYDAPGPREILVKVIDIFGNDTTKLLRVDVP
ncbi:MAG: DNA methyltransferase, partial [Chloroflexota bacterium]